MATAVLPPDVRLLNGAATALFVLAALALVAVALAALARLPAFSLAAIAVDGQLERANAATLRASAAPRLSGNFFSVDLDAAREAFESVPWVRRAVVRRVWPNRLGVTLEEHDAAGMWNGADGVERLVNRQGEVFEANVGDVEDERLPLLAGPDGTAAQVLAMHGRLAPLLSATGARLQALTLSRRGAWRAELDSGALLELGGGGDDEIVERVARFARTWAQVDARFQRPLEVADLRHGDGYAVRLKGVTTVPPDGAAAKRQRQ